MSSVAVGIDLGVNGAVAVIDGDAVTVQPLPLLDDRTLDGYELAVILSKHLVGSTLLCDFFDVQVLPPHFIVYEAVFRPNSLVRMQGEVAATCKVLDLQHDDVPVVRWKRAVLGENTSDKQVVLDWCKRTYPDVNLRRTPRARTDSHDFADAIALAHYAKGLLNAAGNGN